MFKSFSALNAQVPTPTSKDHVAFIFTCLDPGSNDHYEVFQGLDLIDAYDIGEEGVSGVSIYRPSSSPSGYTEINVDNIDDYRGFGVVGLFTETSGGEFIYLSVYFIECCEGPPTPSLIIAEQEPISFWEPSAVISGEQVLVLGNIEIDVSVNFDNNLFEMGTDASFELSNSVHLESFDDTYQPYCEFAWDRIHAPNASNVIKFENNTFWTGALRGVHGENNAEIQIIESHAENNFIAVMLEEYTNGGPFEEGSYFSISGSTIETVGLIILPHISSPIDIITPQTINSLVSKVGIRVINSNYVVVGHSSLLPNSFERASDDFAAIGVTDSWVIIENNDFISDDNNFAVMANSSAIRMGGPNLSQGNYIENFHMRLFECSATIQNCYFNGPMTGTPGRIWFDESTPITPPDANEGVFLLNNFFYNYEVDILNNISPTTSLDVDIKDNIAEVSTFTINSVQGIPPFSTNPRLTINDNTFLNGHRDFIVKIYNCHYATIGDNIFRNSQLSYDISSSQGTEAVGVFLHNSPNVGLYSNIFLPLVAGTPQVGFKSGVYAFGDVHNLDLYCNEFYNVYNGVQFYNATITSDIGVAGTTPPSPGLGANNTFQLLPGFPGIGALFTVPNAALISHFNISSNQIDYNFQGSTGTIYDPDDYGFEGVEQLRGLIIPDDGANSGCPSVPQKRFERPKEEPETQEKLFVNAYPNPAPHQMTVDIPDEYFGANYFISDVHGRVVQTEVLSTSQLELSLPGGQYILLINSPSGTPVRKKLVFFN